MTNKKPAKQASRAFLCRSPEGTLVGQGLLDFTSGFLELVDSRVTSEQAAGRFGRGICSGAADFLSRFCFGACNAGFCKRFTAAAASLRSGSLTPKRAATL